MTLLFVALCVGATAEAEDGYELWLRYPLVSDARLLKQYRESSAALLVAGDSPTARIVREELSRGLRGLLGAEIPLARDVSRDGVLVAGTPTSSPIIAGLRLDEDLTPEQLAEVARAVEADFARLVRLS